MIYITLIKSIKDAACCSLSNENCSRGFTGLLVCTLVFWVRHPDELQKQRNRTRVLSVVPVSAGYRLLHSGSGAVTVLDP